jgi:hypothetical protein
MSKQVKNKKKQVEPLKTKIKTSEILRVWNYLVDNASGVGFSFPLLYNGLDSAFEIESDVDIRGLAWETPAPAVVRSTGKPIKKRGGYYGH